MRLSSLPGRPSGAIPPCRLYPGRRSRQCRTPWRRSARPASRAARRGPPPPSHWPSCRSRNGAPLLVVVGLKPIQEALGTDRSVVALAGALVWVGTGLGGIMMGWLADRIGIRFSVFTGAVMMAAGLALSSTGSVWALYVGHGLLIGLLGNGAIYAPLVVYVSRWFDRRRGSALALIIVRPVRCGRRLAVGVRARDRRRSTGWSATMMAYAAVVVVVIVLADAAVPSADTRGTGVARIVLRSAKGWAWPGTAAEPHAGAPFCRGLHVLCADGDAAEPPGRRRLQRPRHRAGTGRGDAFRAARLRVFLPADVGLVRRPYRRAADGGAAP